MESNRNTTIQVYGGEAYKGPQGLQGPVGPQGPRGEQGPVGPKGADGINGKDGRDGIDGKDGQDGKGIKSITLVDTKDKVKTYRIEYTDGTSFDFEVKDGEDGSNGKGGMSGGAVLRGAEKTSRKSQDYTDTSKETYPSSYALAAAVTQLRSEIPTDYIQIRRVDELPDEGEANVLYLVPTDDPDTNNIYNEYIWTIQDDETYDWELIGSTEIDLSGYITDVQVNNTSIVTDGVAKLQTSTAYGTGITGNSLYVVKASDADITAKSSAYKPIVPNSLDKAVKAGLTSNSQITTDEDKNSICSTIGAERVSSVVTLSATDSITLAHNKIFNGSTQTALTITLWDTPSVTSISEVVFTSGATATTLSYSNTIKWLGDDITGGLFVPVASKRYTVMFYYDGVETVGVVKGVA